MDEENKTQLILTIGDSFYEVEPWTPETRFRKEHGYMKGEYVYIYRGKFKKDSTAPGIYKRTGRFNKGEMVVLEPKGKQAEMYHVKNVREIDTDAIFNKLDADPEDFMSIEDVEIINNNSEMYVPTIKEDDDFLKVVIKKAIIEKKINLLNYKNSFNSQYTLNNMKSSLNRETKMTVPKFLMWCEVLGLDFELRLTDNGTDTRTPLLNDVVITNNDIIEE